jgi:hypothetical protein
VVWSWFDGGLKVGRWWPGSGLVVVHRWSSDGSGVPQWWSGGDSRVVRGGSVVV